LPGRPFLSRHLRRRAAGAPRSPFHRAVAPAAGPAVRPGGIAVSGALSLDEKYFLREACSAPRASGLLLLFGADPQRHPKRDGGDGVLSLRPALRSGGLRD